VWFPSDDKTLNMSWMVTIVESSTTVVSGFPWQQLHINERGVYEDGGK
jgi:hypothetical protein